MIPSTENNSPAPEALDYDSPGSLRRFMDQRGLGMQKKFGQNFLVNPDARRRLADALQASRDGTVWEVGPGLGAMTTELLDRGLRVHAFEIDRGFAQVLREKFGTDPRFTLVEGDVLKTWPAAGQSGRPECFFGNLPYNIAATLIADFIEAGFFFSRAVVTVQKEVAQRMVARPGAEGYSSFSVLCASAYDVVPTMTLKGGSFYPIPNVDSQAVRMDLRTDRDPADYPRLFRPLVRALFASRRKTVRNNLLSFAASRWKGSPETLDDLVSTVLEQSGIKKEERAERLSVDEFAAIARALGERI